MSSCELLSLPGACAACPSHSALGPLHCILSRWTCLSIALSEPINYSNAATYLITGPHPGTPPSRTCPLRLRPVFSSVSSRPQQFRPVSPQLDPRPTFPAPCLFPPV